MPLLHRLMSLSICLLALQASSAHAADRIVLQNGTIHRGDGSEPFVGSIAIEGDRIAAIGSEPLEGSLVLDCTGLVIAPGFIDLHSHSDRSLLKKETQGNVNYLLQGCTTVLTGNCGSGPIDVGKFLDEVDDKGTGTHVAHLLPHGSLRSHVMGTDDRAPSAEELSQMCELAEQAMQEGAFGMSTGLFYIPGTFARTEEIIELSKIIGQHGGFYASHMRDEQTELMASVKELIRIGHEAKLPVHISHLKVKDRANWGSLRMAIDLAEQARQLGVIVTADQYPYVASSTSLSATLCPRWPFEGGRRKFMTRVNDPELLARMRKEIAEMIRLADRVQLARCGYRPDWVGLSIAEIAQREGKEQADIVLEIEQHGGASVVNFAMNEEDMRYAMNIPWVATASDGTAQILSADRPHPRSFGTFPRKVGRYTRELEVIPLAAAIRSCTSLPAEIMGLTDRGRLETGLVADVVVFDPATFTDRATFEQPQLPPVGMQHVFVAGVPAVYDGQATGALAGRAIRKKAPQQSKAASVSKERSR